ncbi:MAG TPA: septum formation initiator family protein [Gemmatimonadales bacterium]|nr:septum formation initiator family protein [Gemmatimonadales bacterium]
MTRARGAGLVAACGLAALAFLAGEYSTLDWLKLRRQLARERQTVRDLEVQLDSLDRLAHALETDPVAQEHAARAQFGMIRKGEMLYRIVPRTDAGSGVTGSPPSPPPASPPPPRPD